MIISNQNNLDSLFNTTSNKLLDLFLIEQKINKVKYSNDGLSHNIINKKNLYFSLLTEYLYVFNNLIEKGNQIVSVYSGNNQLYLSPSFYRIKGINENEVKTRMENGELFLRITYEGLSETIIKARKYIALLLSGEIDGYKNVEFKMPVLEGKNIKSILWNTIMLPNGLNVRIGFDSLGNKDFYKEELIYDIDYSNLLYFSKKIDKIISKLDSIGNSLDNELTGNIRLLALILDLFLKYGSMPATIYKGDEPILLNDAFINLTEYSREEIYAYYKENGEIMSLFYKGEDYKKVIKYLNYLNENLYTGNGYDDVDFTMTTKTDNDGKYKRITILWTNYIAGGLSLRSGIIKEIITYKRYKK